MRIAAIVLLAVFLSGCSSSSSSGTSAPGTSTSAPRTSAPSTSAPGTSTSAPRTSAPRTSATSTSIAENTLGALLPTTVNGVAVTKTGLNPVKMPSPRVFLKVIARLGKTPPDALLALAFGSGATVYAMRVNGTSGSDIAQAFLGERPGATPESGAPPVASIGGKQVTRLGNLVGTFVYASGDVFFYVEAPDELTAADVLKQLP